MDSPTDPQNRFPSSTAADPPRRVAFAAQDLEDWRTAINHPAMTASLRIANLVLRGLVLFVFSFIEIVAELLAPIVLIIGIGWSVLPSILSMAGPDPEARTFLTTVAQTIPKDIHLGHTILTPTNLIVDGFVLIAVVALCRTIHAIVSAEA